MLRTLWNDEAGVIISAELVLVLTIGVISVVVGLNAVAKSVNNELFDVASAIGAVDQSYYVTGFKNIHGNAAFASGKYGKGGFGFKDKSDECDCAIMVTPGGNVKEGYGRRSEAGGYGGGRR
ncbi:hypothetical protein [Calycomorphotria hydatis]|uniref:Branched-chain amino acid aminotransferase n=1 Tax=Calycomorphotria hydatis TaxID=2528027 RepID=A0A517T8D8_9PLAN|nr:hypothetical protein [Calycomorphotria hydatis]QDT64660.1 hypothetical protein V22_19000 [Calycomorphotria hydatis]